MLPQEVKEIGVGKAIIFYEGLRPIFCEKIRYFEDKRLKVRLEPAPMVAAIDTAKVVHGEQEEFAVESAAPSAAVANTVALESIDEIVTRPVIAADIANLDSLDLEDFSVNFEHVENPRGRPLNDEEMRNAVDALLDSMTS